MNLTAINPDNKVLLLGTALWGWGVGRPEAQAMLSRYAERGGVLVDTAANYPINQRPQDFGLANRWVAEWLAQGNAPALKILGKIGATDNMGGPDPDLSIAAVKRAAQHYQQMFDSALEVLAVHWDNRGDAPGDLEAISETLGLLHEFNQQGLAVGFSGVRHPELYRQLAPALADQWWIQVKENAQTRAARAAYQGHFPKARYLAYGINMGGLKATPAQADSSMALRGLTRPNALATKLSEFLQSDHGIVPAPQNFNELALLASYTNPALSGIIIGPRTLKQLDSTLDYWQSLQQLPAHDQFNVHQEVLRLAQ